MLHKGDYALGPDTGQIHVRTGREGMASKVGHDLTCGFTRWSGRLTADSDDPAAVRVEVTVEMASFTVLEGTGGVKPLSDGDKADITKNAMKVLEVEKHPTAKFVAERSAPNSTFEGTLTLCGQSGPLKLESTSTGDNSWRVTGTLAQSAFGIKPFKAMLGALRLADEVTVEATLTLT
jgi:polyisoprenoid-binding protein YceI